MVISTSLVGNFMCRLFCISLLWTIAGRLMILLASSSDVFVYNFENKCLLLEFLSLWYWLYVLVKYFFGIQILNVEKSKKRYIILVQFWKELTGFFFFSVKKFAFWAENIWIACQWHAYPCIGHYHDSHVNVQVNGSIKIYSCSLRQLSSCLHLCTGQVFLYLHIYKHYRTQSMLSKSVHCHTTYY